MKSENKTCFFVSDLHGNTSRYEKLFRYIRKEKPHAVFLGGDLLPNPFRALSSLDLKHRDFINNFLTVEFDKLRQELGNSYPTVFLILGNDDARFEEAAILDIAKRGLWQYAHNRKIKFGEFKVCGYSYVPPSPFMLKDWERYDVSRYVDPGCVSPEEGRRSVPVSAREARYSTISEDLKQLTEDDDLTNTVFLFHTPPYKTKLDRAALDGKKVDHVPLDVHVGSIAVKRFIKAQKPLLTLHGHIHESARLTGAWKEKIGQTICITAAHDGQELALVRFDLNEPDGAMRDLI